MSFREDLVAQANAALALGDWFVPPEGATVRWAAGYQVGSVVCGSSCATEIKIRTAFSWADGTAGVSDTWLDRDIGFEIVDFEDVEGEVPPFEEWRRPEGGNDATA